MLSVYGCVFCTLEVFRLYCSSIILLIVGVSNLIFPCWCSNLAKDCSISVIFSNFLRQPPSEWVVLRRSSEYGRYSIQPSGHRSLISWSVVGTVCCDTWSRVTEPIVVYKSLLLYDTWSIVVVTQVNSTLIGLIIDSNSLLWSKWTQHTEVFNKTA